MVPVFFTQADRELALALTAAGRPVQEIALQLMMEVQAFQLRRRKDYADPKLKAQWDAAALEGIESLADSLVDVDTRKGPYQARIYSENIKWLLARRAAAKYGDRLDITQGVTTVDISRALEDARARAMVAHAVPVQIAVQVDEDLEESKAVESLDDLLS